jgi:hypothetical protein
MRNGNLTKVNIRYRLRTLLLAGAFGPPLLVLGWYVGVWASFALPGFIKDIAGSLTWLSGLIAMGLTVFVVRGRRCHQVALAATCARRHTIVPGRDIGSHSAF